MAKVLFDGWNYGLRKISLTELIQSKAILPLNEAKEFTNQLLDGKKFAIEIDGIEQATDLVKEATAEEAVCEIIEDND